MGREVPSEGRRLLALWFEVIVGCAMVVAFFGSIIATVSLWDSHSDWAFPVGIVAFLYVTFCVALLSSCEE